MNPPRQVLSNTFRTASDRPTYDLLLRIASEILKLKLYLKKNFDFSFCFSQLGLFSKIEI